MDNFPPPPRRTAAPPTPPPAPKSFWGRASELGGQSWNGLYRVADSVGTWSNKQTAKMGTEAFYPTSLDVECTKAARILRTFTMDASELPQENLVDMKKRQRVIKKIPSSVLANCHGLAIFTVFRTGFLISGASGSGVVMARLPDGSWSAPSGVLLHTVGFGFLAGADIVDIVLILRTDTAVESFTRPRVTLGGEVSIAAGPVGNGFAIESGANLAPVWSYVKSKGLFGGVQVNGQILIERNDENARSYGVLVTAAEILDGEVRPPYWCEGLHETIRAAEGKDYRTSLIPLGASPSDTTLSARRLPPEELDSDDLAARAEMEEALRSFGIEDPTINASLRAEDPLLLTGPDLELLSTPALSAGSPALDSANSSIYPLSLDGSTSPPLRAQGPPPPLPPRGSREFPAGERLVEVVECPPPEEEEGRRSEEKEGGKPKVPPRRSPRVEGGSPKVEEEKSEEKSGEKSEKKGEEKEGSTEDGGEKWEEAEEKKEQVVA